MFRATPAGVRRETPKPGENMPLLIPSRAPSAKRKPGIPDLPAAAGRSPARSGFSLIEVLIALALVAIVLLGTAEMLIRAIQIRRSAEDRLRLTEAACTQLERLKGADPNGPDLEIGHHEASVEAGSKGAIVLTWEVEEAGPGTLQVRCAAAGPGGTGGGRSQVGVSVLVSKHLGF